MLKRAQSGNDTPVDSGKSTKLSFGEFFGISLFFRNVMSRNIVEAGHYCKKVKKEVTFRGLTGGMLICPECHNALQPEPRTLFESKFPDEAKRRFIQNLFNEKGGDVL